MSSDRKALKNLRQCPRGCGKTQRGGAGSGSADRELTAQLTTEVGSHFNDGRFNQHLHAPDIETIDDVHDIDHVGRVGSYDQRVDRLIGLNADFDHACVIA